MFSIESVCSGDFQYYYHYYSYYYHIIIILVYIIIYYYLLFIINIIIIININIPVGPDVIFHLKFVPLFVTATLLLLCQSG